MLELQRTRFAGWALTEGQHRPKAGKKKKTREAGLFFSGSRFVLDASSGSGLTQRSPNRKSLSIYLSSIFGYLSKLYVDRRQSPGQLVFFRVQGVFRPIVGAGS